MVNSCGECEECRAGQEQNCLNGQVGTYNSTDVDDTITQGGYAEKVVVNERFVCRIPDALDFDVAAPLLCAGITTYGTTNRWGAGETKDGAPRRSPFWDSADSATWASRSPSPWAPTSPSFPGTLNKEKASTRARREADARDN